MQTMKRTIALLLAAAMLLGVAGCASLPQDSNASLQISPQRNPESTDPNPTVPPAPAQPSELPHQTEAPEDPDPWQPQEYESSYTPLNLPAEEPEREDLEQILDLVSKDSVSEEEISDLDEEELTQLIEDLLEQPQTENPTLRPDLTVPVDTNRDAIREDGSLKQPFDLTYPELMEQVIFSGESLLVKMDSYSDGEVSDDLRQCGVGQLDLLFSMDDAAWYEAHLVAGTETGEAITALRQCDEVLLADYNYTARADAMAQAESITDAIKGNAKVSDQWYLQYCGIPSGLSAMTAPGGSPNVIVAVIDTGVDYDHVDLADNIWVNDKEIPDNGIDDDNNGYTDDYYGVNIITGNGNGDDDNGHGTHVAGIIAARNNNLGTVGIAYNVKIMPIKALNHEGTTNDADIVAAIIYAMENGAEIINMSFGQEAISISVQDALKIASRQCVLVASAGNDGAANEGENSIPNYPAALSYVMGVMSVDRNGKESSFSSYDSKAFNGIEYELYAPGEAILSTIPGDRYASWSGTSMAAPMVSAMAALLRSHYSDRSKYTPEFIYGQLIATSGHFADCGNHNKHGEHTKAPIANLHTALTKLPEPDVVLSSYNLFDTQGFEQDTAGLNNGDGVVDAGETFALGLTLRNRWGAGANTLVSLSTDSAYVTLHNPTVDYEKIGTYSTKDAGKIYTDDLLTGWETPFYITVSEDCPGSTVVELKVTVSCTNDLNPSDTKTYTWEGSVLLQVRSGAILPKVIEEDMTLKAGNLYLVYDATTIEAGVTVTAEPGSMIQFWSADRNDPYADDYMPELHVRGRFLVQGTKENPVQIFPAEQIIEIDENGYTNTHNNLAVKIDEQGSGCVSLVYADVTNLTADCTYAYGCTFRVKHPLNSLHYRYLNSSGGYVSWSSDWPHLIFEEAENCVVYQFYETELDGTWKRCAFVNSDITFQYYDNNVYQDCLFLGNTYTYTYSNTEKDITTTHYASSYTARDLNHTLSANSIDTYYWPETGTTYFRVHNNENAVQQTELYVKSLGGTFATIETEQELNWLRNHLPIGYSDSTDPSYRYRYDLGIHYDFLDQMYVWSDGSSLGDFLHLEGVSDTYTTRNLYLLGGELADRNQSYWSQYSLYEIPGPIYLTDIRLNQYNVLLDLDTTYQIVPSTAPVNVEPEALVFTSDNEDVLTVDESGLVTPVGQGVANVTVSCADGYISTYATFYVRALKPLESLAFETEQIVLPVGENTETSLVYSPVDTTRKAVSYASSDEAIVSVDRLGRLSAKAPGDAVITVTSSEVDENGNPITAQLKVHTYRQATGLTIESDTLLTSFGLDERVSFPEYTLIPEDAETELTWRSTDPQVVEVDPETGDLTVTGTGTATVVLADLRSGLSVSCLVIVADEGEILALQDIRSNGSYHYALSDDGTLYYWSNDSSYKTPVAVATDVSQYDAANSYLFLQKKDGSLYQYYHNGFYPLPEFDGTVQMLKRNAYSDYYILDENGAVYFKTDSETSTPWRLLNTMEDAVVDVVSGYNYTWLLTEFGDLYCIPSGETILSDPLLEDVVMLGDTSKHYDGYQITVLTEDGHLAQVNQSGSVTYSTNPVPETDALFLDAASSNCWGIKDGIAFEIPFYASENPTVNQFPKIDNVVFVEHDNTYHGVTYVITEEGLLYAVGKNGNNAFAGTTSDTDITDPVLIPMSPVEDALRITGTNLAEDTVLFADTLELEFSNTLKAAPARLFAGDRELRFTASIHDENFLTVSLKEGFQKDVRYRLVFDAQSIRAPYNVTNEEAIELTFTYGLEQTEDALTVLASESDVVMDILNIHDWSGLELSWYTTDESVAFVDENNLLQPVSEGITTIAFREAISGLEGTVDVTVWQPLTEDLAEEIHPVTQLMALEGTDLSNTSFGDTPWTMILPELTLDFSNPVQSVNYELAQVVSVTNRGDEVTTPVETDYEISLDRVTVTPASELDMYGIYKLTVSGQGTTGTYAAEDTAWTETFTFIYIPEELEEIIDTTVTRDPTTDETVERFYWDKHIFIDSILEKQEELNLNYQFLGNVILNRISTDTNPDHWLRIQAPTSESITTTIPMGGNYWGTTSETAIGLQILDYYDFTTYSKIASSPWLETAPENTFPFVTGLTIYDKTGAAVTHLSNQEITVRVTFNRDMDTAVPLNLTFGNNYPYDQHTIEGSYTDARTWQGSYLLTSLLEDGNHYFCISGGRSAQDGLELFSDWGRFGFELDTATAQAMLMQAEATTEGIHLSWSQDDFSTLMGYNIYRTVGNENAYPQRINTSVIPADTKEYLDTNVEPGVVYHYSFSVVQTDLSESSPSKKIQIMSLDTMAPELYHTPVYTTPMGANLMITATVKDNVGIENVYVYYRNIGQSEWSTAVMNSLNNKYSVLIPGDQISADGLEYYIEATDGVSSTFRGSADSPFQVEIIAAADESAKGDVNGDGKISAVDALMLLKAINNVSYLNQEQFTRADLNGNGILEAVEALRILQYVSGKVGSVKMA